MDAVLERICKDLVAEGEAHGKGCAVSDSSDFSRWPMGESALGSKISSQVKSGQGERNGLL